jgi:hypothetical protein
VQLTAVAEPGWRFTAWSGDISTTENPASLIMMGDRNVTAHFEEFIDTVPPVISGVQVSANDQQATISWLTDEPAASQVEYGTTPSYELGKVSNNALAMSHSVILSGLSPNTVYNYQIRVTDASGNTAVTQNATFSTQGQDTVIDVWYGEEQTFGSLGNPQEWVNIMGNVSDSDGIASLSYSLNGGAAIPSICGPYPLPAGETWGLQYRYSQNEPAPRRKSRSSLQLRINSTTSTAVR